MIRRSFLLPLLLLAATTAFAQPGRSYDREARKARRNQPPVTSIYGLNLVHVTEDNVGFAVSYERFLNSTGIVSLYLPLSVSFSQGDNITESETYYGYGYGYYPGATSDYTFNKGMVYFYPGVKVYPAGAHKKVSWAIGSSLVLGVGSADQVHATYQVDTFQTVPPQPYPYYKRTLVAQDDESVMRFKLGVLLTNSLNLRPTSNLYLGIEFGIGYSYLSMVDGRHADRDALVQIGLKMGFAK